MLVAVDVRNGHTRILDPAQLCREFTPHLFQIDFAAQVLTEQGIMVRIKNTVFCYQGRNLFGRQDRTAIGVK